MELVRKKLYGSSLALLAVVALIGGCAPVADTESAVEATARPMTSAELAEHQEFSDAFGAAFVAGDSEALGELHTDDAVLMPAGMPTVNGKEDIVAVFTMFPPIAEFETRVVEGIIMGDTAVVRGEVTLTVAMGEEEVSSDAKFIEIRERQEDGSWLLARDIFNYDAPPPDASAEIDAG